MNLPRKTVVIFMVGFMTTGLVGYAVLHPPAIVCSPGVRAIPDIESLATRLDHYKTLNGAYPTTEQGLQVLGAVPKDPWANDYVYRYPGKRHPDGYDLFSAGPDRTIDSMDDEWGK